MKTTLLQYYSSPQWPESLMDIQPADIIQIAGKKYPVYKELKYNLTFGQKTVLCKDNSATKHEWIKKILSIIYQPLILNCKFDDEKAVEIEKLIESCQVIQAYPTAMFYHSQLLKIVEFENEKLTNEPDPDSVAAGIDKLAVWGIYGVADSFSKGKPWKHKKFYNQPYMDIFMKLWYDVEKSKFEKRLREVLKFKKPIK